MGEGDKSVVLRPLTGKVEFSGQGVAAVADSPSKVDISDFNRGRSSTWRDESGLIHVAMRDSLLRGRDNEPSVLDVLGQLCAGTIEPGDDARGEDARLCIADGTVLVIQIVTVPPEEEINRQVRQGLTVERVLTIPEAAAWIHMSIQKKLKVRSTTTVLALDARHLGVLVDEDILAEFRRAFPNTQACGFNQIWLSGPTAARSTRLV